MPAPMSGSGAGIGIQGGSGGGGLGGGMAGGEAVGDDYYEVSFTDMVSLSVDW